MTTHMKLCDIQRGFFMPFFFNESKLNYDVETIN